MGMRVISGSHRGRQLITLRGELTRPSPGKVREAVFSSLQFEIPGSLCLDLCAGSGGMGIEALSRGADYCWFVDNYPPACRVIRTNLESLAYTYERATVLCLDAAVACQQLSAQGKRVDIVFLDPPYYNLNLYMRAIETIEFVLKPRSFLVIEHSQHYLPQVSYAKNIKTKKYGSSAITYYRNGGE